MAFNNADALKRSNNMEDRNYCGKRRPNLDFDGFSHTHYKQFVGKTIVGMRIETDDEGNQWPVFTLDDGYSQYNVQVSSDQELNQPGFLTFDFLQRSPMMDDDSLECSTPKDVVVLNTELQNLLDEDDK